jgi:hypothetical protein
MPKGGASGSEGSNLTPSRVVGRNVLTNILGLKVHGTKARWQYCNVVRGVNGHP